MENGKKNKYKMFAFKSDEKSLLNNSIYNPYDKDGPKVWN